ncbi:MAG: ribosome biogenesis protein [Nitrososphaeria archaeon]|jgi:rRNA small subunit pseudouridine methyltransferase Nep1
MTRITLIIAESSLEIIPEEIMNEKIIKMFCKRKAKLPEQTLLDQSYHHKAILKLSQPEKRGRPDIAHFSLLEATSIPLYFRDQLDVYLHTIDDKVIWIGKNVRLPKVYERFIGLIEQLYVKESISYQGKELLRLSKSSLEGLLNEVKPSTVIGLSRIGKHSGFEEISEHALKYGRPALVVGGFARGHFSEKNLKLMNNVFSVSEYGLEAHVVVSRILYETEKLLNIS